MISKIKDFVFINDEFFVFPLIEKIKTKEEYRRIFSNFLSLSFLQAANYILPLITLPYLVRVLGPEKFGLISFAQAFTAYFQIITDYGFNLSATREISINRENKEKVSEIFSSVMFIKFGLLFVSLVLMSVILFSFNKFRQDWLIYYLTFGMVLGQTLFPVWFFQGMERMKYITFLNIVAKLIFTFAIFVFVKHESNYLYVPLLNSIGFIIAGILSLWIIFKNFEIDFKISGLEEIKYHLKEGWYIFISTISGNLYGQGNILILGLFSSNEVIGYYAAAQKIVIALISLFQVISQSIFPYLVILKENIHKFKIFFIKIFKFVFIIDLLILFSLFSISFYKNVYTLITGYTSEVGIISFWGWIIIGFFTIFNVILNSFAISLKQDKKILKMYFWVGTLFVFFSSILTWFYSYLGMLFSMLFVEIIIFAFLNTIIRKVILNYRIE